MDDNKALERATHKIKVGMPLDKAIEAMQDIIDLANSTTTDPMYVIAAGMALDALKREAAARLFLRVTAVRVKRLQDITEEQAVMEGIFLHSPDFIPTYHYDKSKCNVPGAGWNTARGCFLWGLWDSTVKPTDRTVYGHFANPWVWVIEFERISKKAALGGGGDG